MPYLRCPSCGLLAHSIAAVAITCPRCRVLPRRHGGLGLTRAGHLVGLTWPSDGGPEDSPEKGFKRLGLAGIREASQTR
jgi:hypothetical protein